MVLHGIALYDLVFYIIYFAFFCVFRFVARAVSRKTPIPLIDTDVLGKDVNDDDDCVDGDGWGVSKSSKCKFTCEFTDNKICKTVNL